MDNNKILEKVKVKIAISNVKEEDIVMNKNRFNAIKKIGIVACAAFSMTGVVFATTQIINKFGKNSSDGVQTAINNDITINIKFDETYNLTNMLSKEGKIDIMDLKVVNENNEKVFATRELESEEMTSLYETEKEAKANYDSYTGGYSQASEKIDEHDLKFYLTATGNEKEFPESKTLKVTFNKIRNKYWENGEEKSIIYNGEWSYEIDVPTKMSKSNIIDYKLVSISDKNYKFKSAKVSNTAFRIYLDNCKDIAWSEKEYVETSDGTKYYPAHRSDGDGEISVKEDGTVTYYNTFNLTNYDATDTLKVHLFKTTGEEVVIELEKEE